MPRRRLHINKPMQGARPSAYARMRFRLTDEARRGPSMERSRQISFADSLEGDFP